MLWLVDITGRCAKRHTNKLLCLAIQRWNEKTCELKTITEYRQKQQQQQFSGGSN